MYYLVTDVQKKCFIISQSTERVGVNQKRLDEICKGRNDNKRRGRERML